MTEADVKRLEGTIGRPLSPPVREFFLNFPPALRDPPDDDELDDFHLTDDVEALIRFHSVGWGNLRPIDWTPRMLMLGSGGCGETFWVDLDSPTGAVYRFDAGQEGRWSDPMSDSLAEWARNLFGDGEE
jgi:hypothetical protein